jgi:DNA-binding LacI/PurR family transcriptional regulator
MQRRPAGLVFFSEGNSWNDRLHRACLKLEVPHLFLDADPKLPGIWINRQSGIEESLRYLYETGSRKIAYLGSLEHSANRLPAYLNVIHEKKLKLRYLDFVYETQNAPRQIGRSWPAMKDPPDAIQAFSDRVAMEFLAGLQDKGLVVPKTVRLVGFDDRPMAQLTSPPLTTVRQPNQEMGKLAAEMLLKMIAGQGTSSFGIATKLIIREST